jgi:hypothetical protein
VYPNSNRLNWKGKPTICGKVFEKPPRNSSGFCGGGQDLSWAVEPRKEEEERKKLKRKLTRFAECIKCF